MPAEPLLIGVGGDPQHHRVAVLPLGEERQRGGLAPELVKRAVQVGQILDLRYRQQAGKARAEREPDDGLLVEQGVEDAPGTEPRVQPAGDAVPTALARYLLAAYQHAGRGGEAVGER